MPDYGLPPTSIGQNKATAQMFFDNSLNLSKQKFIHPSKLFMLDFNFHLDVPTDAHAVKLINTLESFGLIQHSSGPIHTAGHTLDLVISCQDDKLVD